jgi:hypothetical protein
LRGAKITMYKKKTIIVKVQSILLLITFLVTSMNGFTYANINSFVFQIKNNNYMSFSDYANIDDKFTSSIQKDVIHIYCIKTLHSNIEAQENIFKILENLKSKNKNFNILGVEGAYEKLDGGLLSRLKNKSLRDRIIKDLVKEGIITGAEKFKILNNNKIELYGLEDEKIYKENFKTLYESLINRDKINPILKEILEDINRVKNVLYSEKLKQIENVSQSYIEKKISFEEYLSCLEKIAVKIGINLNKNYPLIKKYQVMFNSKYENTLAYKNIDMSKVLEEAEELLFELKTQLAKGTGDSEDLVKYEYYAKLFYKYINNESSARGVENWITNRNNFYEKANTIGRLINRRDIVEENMGTIKEAENNMDKFYKLAEKRNEIMINKMLIEMENKKEKTGVIVTGGYHTNGITEILRNKGISYTVISPKLKKESDNGKYIEGIKEQARYMEFVNKDKELKNINIKKDKLELILELQKEGRIADATINNYLINIGSKQYIGQLDSAIREITFGLRLNRRKLCVNKCRREYQHNIVEEESNTGFDIVSRHRNGIGLKILNYLPIADLKSCSCVCQKWKKLVFEVEGYEPIFKIKCIIWCRNKGKDESYLYKVLEKYGNRWKNLYIALCSGKQLIPITEQEYKKRIIYYKSLSESKSSNKTIDENDMNLILTNIIENIDTLRVPEDINILEYIFFHAGSKTEIKIKVIEIIYNIILKIDDNKKADAEEKLIDLLLSDDLNNIFNNANKDLKKKIIKILTYAVEIRETNLPEMKLKDLLLNDDLSAMFNKSNDSLKIVIIQALLCIHKYAINEENRNHATKGLTALLLNSDFNVTFNNGSEDLKITVIDALEYICEFADSVSMKNKTMEKIRELYRHKEISDECKMEIIKVLDHLSGISNLVNIKEGVIQDLVQLYAESDDNCRNEIIQTFENMGNIAIIKLFELYKDTAKNDEYKINIIRIFMHMCKINQNKENIITKFKALISTDNLNMIFAQAHADLKKIILEALVYICNFSNNSINNNDVIKKLEELYINEKTDDFKIIIIRTLTDIGSFANNIENSKNAINKLGELYTKENIDKYKEMIIENLKNVSLNSNDIESSKNAIKKLGELYRMENTSIYKKNIRIILRYIGSCANGNGKRHLNVAIVELATLLFNGNFDEMFSSSNENYLKEDIIDSLEDLSSFAKESEDSYKVIEKLGELYLKSREASIKIKIILTLQKIAFNFNNVVEVRKKAVEKLGDLYINEKVENYKIEIIDVLITIVSSMMTKDDSLRKLANDNVKRYTIEKLEKLILIPNFADIFNKVSVNFQKSIINAVTIMGSFSEKSEITQHVTRKLRKLYMSQVNDDIKEKIIMVLKLIAIDSIEDGHYAITELIVLYENEKKYKLKIKIIEALEIISAFANTDTNRQQARAQLITFLCSNELSEMIIKVGFELQGDIIKILDKAIINFKNINDVKQKIKQKLEELYVNKEVSNTIKSNIRNILDKINDEEREVRELEKIMRLEGDAGRIRVELDAIWNKIEMIANSNSNKYVSREEMLKVLNNEFPNIVNAIADLQIKEEDIIEESKDVKYLPGSLFLYYESEIKQFKKGKDIKKETICVMSDGMVIYSLEDRSLGTFSKIMARPVGCNIKINQFRKLNMDVVNVLREILPIKNNERMFVKLRDIIVDCIYRQNNDRLFEPRFIRAISSAL